MSPTSPRQPGAGGVRHAAFKVHRDSHSIHKQATSPPSSSSTNSSVSSSSNAAITSNTHRPPPAPPRQKQPQQQQQPVIIYTHSPKVIRTNPRDFMSIVQKLTGLDSPGGPARGGAPPAARVGAGPVASASASTAAAAQDESSSSSSESCANAHAAGPPPPPYAADSQLMPPPARPLDAHFMAPDIPLFPDAPELQQLCAARGLYGHQFPPVDGAALGPAMATNVSGGAAGNGGAAFSPSMVEAMRAFPDYN